MQARKVLLPILMFAVILPYACMRRPREPVPSPPPLPMVEDPYQGAVFLLSPYLDESFLGKGMSNGALSPSASFTCGYVLHCAVPGGPNTRRFTAMKSSSAQLSGLLVSIGKLQASVGVDTYVEYKLTESEYLVLMEPLYNKASACCTSDGTPDVACRQGYAYKAWYGKGSYRTYTRLLESAGAGASLTAGVEVAALGAERYLASEEHTFAGYFAIYLDDAVAFCQRAKKLGLLSDDARNLCSKTASPADSSRLAYVEPLPDAGPPVTRQCSWHEGDGGP